MDPGVTHLVAPAPFGGLERVVSSLAAGLHRSGWPVEVAVLGGGVGDSALVRACRSAGVAVAVIPGGPRAYFRQAAGVSARLRASGHRVLHSHGYHADAIARVAGPPVRVMTCHGFTGGGVRNRGYEWLQRRLARGCDAVVAVAEPLRKRLAESGVPPGRLHLIRNAIPVPDSLPRAEARRILGVAGDAPLIGWVGRLSLEKGPDLFVEAMAALRGPAADAVVVGDGPARRDVEQRIIDRNLTGRVRLAGAIPDAARILLAFDVLALTSRTEGTPIVLLEAMLLGVPVVATRVGGVPDVISPAEGGLVEPEPDAIAAALGRVLSDRSEAAVLATAAGVRARRDFEYAGWLEAHRQLYREVTR